MSNSSGRYAVPAEILKLKPRGTMVKNIHDGFYVYAIGECEEFTDRKMANEIGRDSWEDYSGRQIYPQ